MHLLAAHNVESDMTPWLKDLLLYLLPVTLLSGCLSYGSPSVAVPRAERDSYVLIEESQRSVTGCTFDYRLYQPADPQTRTSIMLGHGFLRDQDNLVGLSRALANHGIPVVTLNFCNMRLWNGNHESNALDMRALAQKLGLSEDIIYGGFSAGALAAVLAANDDTRAILALDLVDQNDLGLNAIRALQTPLIGVSGPASSCNANGNGAALFTSRAQPSLSDLITIEGASHCEFESPSNWLCEIACGDEDNEQDDERERAAIIEKTIDSLSPYLESR